MSSKASKRLVPELRFPEFRDAQPWKPNTVKGLCELKAGQFVSASDIKEKPGDALYPCYGGNGPRGYTKTFTHAGTYPLIGRQGALCGNVRQADGKFHATEHAVVATPRERTNVDWLFHLLVTLSLNRYATGQAQPGLSVDVIEKVSVAAPLPVEQKKIADCLSSIDDLITAQAKEIEALKAHKKGLMQQLFPAEGETVPRLRFPEFRDAKEWRKKSLSELTTYIDYRGKSPIKSEQGVFLVTAKNIKQGYIDYESSKEYVSLSEYDEAMKRGKPNIGDVLLTTEAPLGNVAQVNNENIALAQRVIKFCGNSLLGNGYLKYYMLGDKFQKLLALKAIGSAVLGIQGKVLHQLPIDYPDKSEQRKISDCLSSLDNLIAAHTQKLGVLKVHKNGLLQGLFPSIPEGEA